MINPISNKRGASLLEVVVTIAIVSIMVLVIFNILNFNVRHNAINQERSINANISNAALNYLQNHDYEKLKTYLDNNNSGYYAIINENNCNDLFNEDVAICLSTLSPKINNKQYNHENFNIYLLPYNDYAKIIALRDTPPDIFPEVLNEYIQNIDTTKNNQSINTNVIRVVVVVKSNISERYDFILEGVVTNE